MLRTTNIRETWEVLPLPTQPSAIVWGGGRSQAARRLPDLTSNPGCSPPGMREDRLP